MAQIIDQHLCAACMEAIDVLLEEPEHMERLWENTAYFKAMLVKMGLTLTKSETPILPILIGDEGVAKQFSHHKCVIFLSELYNIRQRSYVAIHGKYAVCHNQTHPIIH